MASGTAPVMLTCMDSPYAPGKALKEVTLSDMLEILVYQQRLTCTMKYWSMEVRSTLFIISTMTLLRQNMKKYWNLPRSKISRWACNRIEDLNSETRSKLRVSFFILALSYVKISIPSHDLDYCCADFCWLLFAGLQRRGFLHDGCHETRSAF